jgi:hypothetical protein
MPAAAAHFYRAILAAKTFLRPAVMNVYSTCQPEKGVVDDQSVAEAKRAVGSRAFPASSSTIRASDRESAISCRCRATQSPVR